MFRPPWLDVQGSTDRCSGLQSLVFSPPWLDVNGTCWQVIEAETQLHLGIPTPLHLGNPTMWFLSWFFRSFLYLLFLISPWSPELWIPGREGAKLSRFTIKWNTLINYEILILSKHANDYGSCMSMSDTILPLKCWWTRWSEDGHMHKEISNTLKLNSVFPVEIHNLISYIHGKQNPTWVKGMICQHIQSKEKDWLNSFLPWTAVYSSWEMEAFEIAAPQWRDCRCRPPTRRQQS